MCKPLSKRRQEVFDLIGQGLSAYEISQKLGISSKTVYVHQDSLKLIMGCANMRELVVTAMKSWDAK